MTKCRHAIGMQVLRLGAATVAVAAALAQPAGAAPARHLHGGGTATISQVAMNIHIGASGSATGSFECLMAGRSKSVLGAFNLKHIMAVHAQPDHASVAGSVVTFSGPGKLVMDNGQHRSITVSVWANVATQTFQLTVVQIGALPVETMLTGHIALG